MTESQLIARIERGELDTVHCAKCGQWAFRCEALTDIGEHEEDGRVFYYCSLDCMEGH